MLTIFLTQPAGTSRLGDFLTSNLSDNTWTHFHAAIAFVKSTGVAHIEDGLSSFCQRADVKLTVGINFGGTSLEGLSRLHELTADHGEIWVFHNGNGSTFHPKVYLFKNSNKAAVAIGSGNLTSGGLYTNYEAALLLALDLAHENDRQSLAAIEAMLAHWRDPTDGTARRLDDQLLDELAARGYLPPEVYSRETEEAGGDEVEDSLFASVPVNPAPPRRTPRPTGVASPLAVSGHTVFFMTLQRTDVGTGQVTPGAAARSPEIFIPLAARNAAPAFWDWPAAFTADAAKPGKMDRFGVRMLIGAAVEDVNMMTWPDKHDFRLRSEAIRSGGRIGDVLRIERTDGSAGYLYVVSIIPQGSTLFPAAKARCTNAVRNSAKEWGYS